MAGEIQGQPLELGVSTPTQSPSRHAPYLPRRSPDPPPLELSPQRPPTYTYGPSFHSSRSELSAAASPHSHTSSRTSYTTGYPANALRNHINVGIDLGTTYSGVSWIISGPDPELHTVRSWPDAQVDNAKVPSVIWYKDGGSVRWGYSVPPEAEALRWFKLLLRNDRDLPPKVQQATQLKTARKLLAKLGKTAGGVLADYLEKLWECTWQDIGREYQSARDSMPFRVVMTVPAKWPEEIRDIMRAAAQKAGLLSRRGGMETKLEFVEEPEAAALSSFHDGSVRQGRREGNIITICDAGGGTADVATYVLESAGPPAQLGEYIGGDADLCGSMFLDEQFIKCIEAMIGKDKLSKMSARVNFELVQAWEYGVKRRYQKNPSDLVPTLPHEVASAIKSPLNMFKKGKVKGSRKLTGDAMQFSADDVAKLFDPVMTSILALIHEQITATIKGRGKKPDTVLLVGGLGSNTFLRQLLNAEFEANNIEIFQPTGYKAWAAVCRGAAIKGATFDEYDDQVMPKFPEVTSYISKAHYGIVYKVPFDESKHAMDDRQFDQATNQWLAYNQMHWYSAKGDDISKTDPKTYSWERYQPESKPCTSFSIRIYEAHDDEAPIRLSPENVRECQSIIIPVQWHRLVVVDGANGERFRRVQFELKMTTSGLGKLDFTTFVDGSPVAQMKVSVKRATSEVPPRALY